MGLPPVVKWGGVGTDKANRPAEGQGQTCPPGPAQRSVGGMMRRFFCVSFGVVSLGLAADSTPWPRAHPPLPRAHAHNDYLHARPLLDALDHGFGSIEADIWLVDDQLLVAHDRKEVRSGRTLEALYLDPLLARFRALGGRIYVEGTPLTLLIDVKSAAGPTYAALHARLGRYAEMLTEFRGDTIRPGQVTVIVSGNRDEAAMRAQPSRYAAMDGRKAHLDSDAPASLVPLLSENWRTLSSWNWIGPMPDDVRRTLGDWVTRTHARGRKLRFWNVPDRPEVWAALLDAGVDVIGTDNLSALRDFLTARATTRQRGRLGEPVKRNGSLGAAQWIRPKRNQGASGGMRTQTARRCRISNGCPRFRCGGSIGMSSGIRGARIRAFSS
jgi:hypothetical protein